MSDFPVRCGMNEFTSQPWTFEEDVRLYRVLGVEAIEVCEAKLDPSRIKDQMRLVEESGMKISAVQPSVRTFFGSRMAPEPAETQARVLRLENSIRTLAPYAPGTVFVTNTGAPPSGNVHRVMDETIQHLRALCPLAEDLGVSLSLEPLNPTSVNVESAIWTIDQAMDIIDGVGHSAMGLCLDYWNIWQQDNVCAAIPRAGNKITILPVRDWHTPYSSTDRLLPRDGCVPVHDVFPAIFPAGFRRACPM